MLKIEEQEGDIVLSLTPRETLFTPLFWKAFGVAVLMHLVGIVLFRLEPYAPEVIASSYSPSIVTVDLPVVIDTFDEGPAWLKPPEFSSVLQKVPEHVSLPFVVEKVLKIEVSGPLSEREWKGDLPPPPKLKQESSITYALHVDDLTGKVIGYERLRFEGDPSLESHAESILAGVTFTKSTGSFTRGEVTISVN